MWKKLVVLWLSLALSQPIFSQINTQQPTLQAPLFDNLGSFHHPISTKNAYAQRFFDQGFILFYGFEWNESIRSFKEAVRLDPSCGMCYWGLALALGAKANAPMTGNEYHEARSAIQKAQALSTHETPEEIAYINALALNFQHPPKKQMMSNPLSCHMAGTPLDTPTKNEKTSYVKAMKKIVTDFPQDNDAKALYANALLNLINWDTWDKDGKANPYTTTILKTLDSAIANDKLHPGANHYYIHTLEPSPHPADALVSAKRLDTLVPGSQHLIHMPTHIYFLTGNYHQSSDSNFHAIAAYKEYSKIARSQGFEPEIGYLYQHDYDFLRSSAAMEGRKKVALTAAHELIENIPQAWIERDPGLQGFIPIPYYVKARFGLWNEILQEPMPKPKYQYALGMWHYARGMAFAHTGELEKAKSEAFQLNVIIQKGPRVSPLGKTGINLLTIGYQILTATLADKNGDEKSTISHLKTALKIQHDMGYHEPPDWYFPVREALGYAYLKWGHPKEASIQFELDLKQYPSNGWALYGLATSYRQLGQTQKADELTKEFRRSWKYADIEVPVVLF